MNTPLNDLQVLTLDCQATGAGPGKGHLLEIGWTQISAAKVDCLQSLSAESYLLHLPPSAVIPPAVRRMTGISEETPEPAFPPAAIWRKVAAAADRVAQADQTDRCPAVIHYARYEEPFLRDLHLGSGTAAGFPLQIICTHEIAKRLLAGLPRKGLRAVAGFFGHALPPHRRSAAHAVATAVVWQHLVAELARQTRIENLEQLTDWLNRPVSAGRPVRVYPMQPDVRRNLPATPGVYRMRRCNGDLLYIGKAASLRSRVNSYFRPGSVRAEHTLEMLSQAVKLDVTLTGSALEAAVLESDEIKSFAPPYNIALQTGHRRLVFCSRDFRQSASQADDIHCIGPLPQGNGTAGVIALAAWLSTSRTAGTENSPQLGCEILGVTGDNGLSPDCLIAGLATFRRRHRRDLQPASPLRSLTGLGAMLWRSYLAAVNSTTADELDEDPAAGDAPDAPSSTDWTPDSVADAIERRVMRSALLIRRSRWLCLLSESSLAWEARDSKQRSKIVLVLEKGAVCRREERLLTQKTSNPPGFSRRMAQRQKNFDLATYERLRVITTELRRLTAAGRRFHIRLSPGAVLHERQLSKLLPWV
jgi:DNA polymerase-3 subunit epsilon